jgi:hypothetical protein
VVDPEPVDETVVDERDGQAVGLLEHLRVLLPDAREVVDVEEAAVLPGFLVDVEELRALLGPVAVGVVDRHVVRDDVEDHAQPRLVSGGDERAELGLTAELLGDGGGVDHVVAVRRARPRLEGRRQVEVRDAEVGQVRHELARRGEAEVAS